VLNAFLTISADVALADAKSAEARVMRGSPLGPFDGTGRSLRQLDLNTRLLKYPCSYMIYSAAFDALPATAKNAVYRKMLRELPKRENGQATLEILRATKKEFPSA